MKITSGMGLRWFYILKCVFLDKHLPKGGSDDEVWIFQQIFISWSLDFFNLLKGGGTALKSKEVLVGWGPDRRTFYSVCGEIFTNMNRTVPMGKVSILPGIWRTRQWWWTGIPLLISDTNGWSNSPGWIIDQGWKRITNATITDLS